VESQPCLAPSVRLAPPEILHDHVWLLPRLLKFELFVHVGFLPLAPSLQASVFRRPQVEAEPVRLEPVLSPEGGAGVSPEGGLGVGGIDRLGGPAGAFAGGSKPWGTEDFEVPSPGS